MSDEQSHDANRSVFYRIRIKGYLSQQRMDWFEGLTVTLEDDGNTLLSGFMVDQSSLHGILKRIRDLGMPLLSVSSGDPDQAAKADTDPAQGGV